MSVKPARPVPAPPGVPKCPLCPRMRRAERPLCNTHMRRVGQPLFDRHFAQVRAAAGKPANSPEVRRLAETIDAMLAMAQRHDDIRAAGYKPFWNAATEQWVSPRERAAELLRAMYRRHRFYLDEANDMAVLDQVAGELVPRLPS